MTHLKTLIAFYINLKPSLASSTVFALGMFIFVVFVVQQIYKYT
jgi:hypothetical protein